MGSQKCTQISTVFCDSSKQVCPRPRTGVEKRAISSGVHGFTREGPFEQGFESVRGVYQEKRRRALKAARGAVQGHVCETWAV